MNVQKARLLSSLLILDGCGLLLNLVLQEFGDKFIEDFLDRFSFTVGFNLEGLPHFGGNLKGYEFLGFVVHIALIITSINILYKF